MEMITKYIFSIICASVIVSICSAFSPKNQMTHAVIKLLSGLFLAITLVSPWLNIRKADISDWFAYIQADADCMLQTADEMNAEAVKDIIIRDTITYIQDKAQELNVQPKIEVILTEEKPYIPYAVVLTGDVSPYAKQKLQRIMEEDLGIAKEYQTWR